MVSEQLLVGLGDIKIVVIKIETDFVLLNRESFRNEFNDELLHVRFSPRLSRLRLRGGRLIGAEFNDEEVFGQKIILDEVGDLVTGMFSGEMFDGSISEKRNVEVGSRSSLMRVEQRVGPKNILCGKCKLESK